MLPRPSVLRPRAAAALLVLIVAAQSPARDDDKAAKPLPVLLPVGAIARLGSTGLRHPDSAFALAYSADGKYLASGGSDGARVWAATGKELRALIPNIGIAGRGPAQNYVRAVALSPDAKTLATDAQDFRVRVWDVATGKESHVLDGPLNGIHSLAFSPDGKTVAAGGRAGTLRLWDAATGHLDAELKYSEIVPTNVEILGFSSDSKNIITRVGSEVIVRPVAGGKDVMRFDTGPGAVALSPDRKRLAWGSGRYEKKDAVRLFDMTKGKATDTAFPDSTGPILSLAFTPDGKSLVGASSDNTIRLWDVATGKELRRFKGQPDWTGLPLVFSPDGKTLAAGSARGVITRWDVATAKLIGVAEDSHEGFPLAAALSPDGKMAVSADLAAAVRLWDVTTGKFVRRLGTSVWDGGRSLGSELAFTPDGGAVLQVYQYGSGTRLWDVATGKELGRWDGYAAVCSPDGKTLAVVDRQVAPMVIRLFDLATGKEKQKLEGKAGRAQQLAFSRDGKALTAVVLGQTEAFVASWDTTTGKERHEPRALPGPWYGAAAVAGRLLAISDMHSGLHVYDLAEREQRRSFVGPYSALSPDGRFLAVPGPEFAITIWEVATGVERHRFDGHHSTVALSLAFSADGRSLVSTGMDGSALVWDVTGRQEKGRLKPSELTTELCEALWADLRSADGAKANEAVWALVADPKASVAFLREHLKPVSPDGQRPRRLAEEIDSDDRDTRQRAADELGRLGPLVEVNLRRALEKKPSLDATRRIKELMEALQPGKPPAPSWMQSWRGIEVLERIGTPEARKVLEAMAEGARPAELTRAAKGALERLPN
jgi:WD40 repeat protein